MSQRMQQPTSKGMIAWMPQHRLHKRMMSSCERLHFAKSQDRLLPIQLAHCNVCLNEGKIDEILFFLRHLRLEKKANMSIYSTFH